MKRLVSSVFTSSRLFSLPLVFRHWYRLSSSNIVCLLHISSFFITISSLIATYRLSSSHFVSHRHMSFLIVFHRFSSSPIVSHRLSSFLVVTCRISTSYIISYPYISLLIVSHRHISYPTFRFSRLPSPFIPPSLLRNFPIISSP